MKRGTIDLSSIKAPPTLVEADEILDAGMSHTTIWVLFKPPPGKRHPWQCQMHVVAADRIVPTKHIVKFQSKRAALMSMSESGTWVERSEGDPPELVGSWV